MMFVAWLRLGFSLPESWEPNVLKADDIWPLVAEEVKHAIAVGGQPLHAFDTVREQPAWEPKHKDNKSQQEAVAFNDTELPLKVLQVVNEGADLTLAYRLVVVARVRLRLFGPSPVSGAAIVNGGALANRWYVATSSASSSVLAIS